MAIFEEFFYDKIDELTMEDITHPMENIPTMGHRFKEPKISLLVINNFENVIGNWEYMKCGSKYDNVKLQMMCGKYAKLQMGDCFIIFHMVSI